MPVRVTQEPLELVGKDTGALARVTQILLEVVGKDTGASARVTQIVLEVVGPVTGDTLEIGAGTKVASPPTVIAGGVVTAVDTAVVLTGTATVASPPTVIGGGSTPSTQTLVGGSTVATPVHEVKIPGSLVDVNQITGTAVVISPPIVFPNGLVYPDILGQATVASPPTVYPGGAISVYASIPGSPAWGGRGNSLARVVRRNEWDRTLAAAVGDMERLIAGSRTGYGLTGLMMGLAEGAGASQNASQLAPGRADGGGLGSLYRGTAPTLPELRVGLRKQFFERGAVLTPAVLAGDTTVVEFRVPVGYFGVVLGYYCYYTGTGFVQGSGDLEWRIRLGRAYPHGLGRIPFAMGSVTNPLPLSKLVVAESGQTVEMVVRTHNLSGLIQVGVANILGGVQGWYYPVG